MELRVKFLGACILLVHGLFYICEANTPDNNVEGEATAIRHS